MKETTITITIPNGYDDIDKEALAEGKISFIKAKPIPWIEESHTIRGYFVNNAAEIIRWDSGNNHESSSKNIFAKRKQAQSMLAMAQLSQIIANDERFGGPITEEEWKNQNVCKRIIVRSGNRIEVDSCYLTYYFLAFHTMGQRDLFLEENEDLIKQYYMLDS